MMVGPTIVVSRDCLSEDTIRMIEAHGICVVARDEIPTVSYAVPEYLPKFIDLPKQKQGPWFRQFEKRERK